MNVAPSGAPAPRLPPSVLQFAFQQNDLAGAVEYLFDTLFLPDGGSDAHAFVEASATLVRILQARGDVRGAERVRAAAKACVERASTYVDPEGATEAGVPGAPRANGAPGTASKNPDRGDASAMEWLLPEDFDERDFVLDAEAEFARSLERILRELGNVPRYVARRLDAPTGLLFVGPSGTGKTTAAHMLAAKLGKPLGVARLDAMESRFVGQTQKNIRAAIEAALEKEALLFFDEVDGLGRNRLLAGPNGDHRVMITNSFLEQLSLVKKRHPELVVVGATNLPETLDPAFVRRMALTVEFAFLSEATRRAQLGKLWVELDADDDAREALIAKTADKSADYLRSLAMASGRAACDAAEGDGRPRVTRAHVNVAVSTVRDEHRKPSRRTESGIVLAR